MVTINLTEEEYIRVRDIIASKNKSVINARRRGVPVIRASTPRVALFVLERVINSPVATVRYITQPSQLPSASAAIPVPVSNPIPIPVTNPTTNPDDTIGSDSEDE
jgi:hypothetical protein